VSSEPRDLEPSSQAVSGPVVEQEQGHGIQGETIDGCKCNFCLCGQEIAHVDVSTDFRPLDISPSWPVAVHSCGLMGDQNGLIRPETCPGCGWRHKARKGRRS